MDLTRWLQRPPILRELPDEVAAAAARSHHADTRGWDADTRPHLATSGRRPAASGRPAEEEGRKREGRKKKGERGWRRKKKGEPKKKGGGRKKDKTDGRGSEPGGAAAAARIHHLGNGYGCGNDVQRRRRRQLPRAHGSRRFPSLSPSSSLILVDEGLVLSRQAMLNNNVVKEKKGRRKGEKREEYRGRRGKPIAGRSPWRSIAH
uniref:DUF834 domain-containing protein n=1 Tax=Oryza glumipatula TaxID=40148 RepID=A0A0D9ZHN4_9ORYZ